MRAVEITANVAGYHDEITLDEVMAIAEGWGPGGGHPMAGHGAGVWIQWGAGPAVVLTAQHVIGGAGNPTVRVDGEGARVRRVSDGEGAEVLKDLAILEPDHAPPLGSVLLVKPNGAFGAALGEWLHVARPSGGLIPARVTYVGIGSFEVETATPGEFGWSGSPLINRDGYLAGILVYLPDLNNMSRHRCTDARAIRAFLDGYEMGDPAEVPGKDV